MNGLKIASDYEETTYHAEKVMFNYSQKEEIKSPGTGEKSDKMAAKTSQKTPRMGNAKQNRNLEKTQGYITQTLL